MRSIITLAMVSLWLLVACQPESDPDSESMIGSIEMELTTTVNGTTYRLNRDNYVIEDNDDSFEYYQYVNAENLAVIQQDLAPGNYTVELQDNWEMQRLLPNGTFETLSAVLTSPNPREFTIEAGQITEVGFTFRAGDAVIPFGNGRVIIEISVEEDYLDTEEPCVPDCSGRECGSDGCGGECGSCATGDSCSTDGQCVPNVLYNITYNTNGGLNGSNPTSYSSDSPTITLAEATKPSYTFDGWYDGSDTQVTSIPTGSTGNLTLTARWVIADYDGNIYTETTIGSQVWMVENMRTTHFDDGTPIAHVIDYGPWSTTSSPAFSWYNNVLNHRTGNLYNWAAANNNRSLCPAGWHVPSSSEWRELQAYCTANYTYYGTAKALAATTGWPYSENPAHIGNNPSTNNDTGFSALPSGFRYFNGGFSSFPVNSDYWWTSTEDDGTYAYDYVLYQSALDDESSDKRSGFNVRCIRDY